MPTSKPPPRDPFSHPALSESLRALARRGQTYNYRRGMLLIQEGDVGDTLFIILSGRLRTFGSDGDGDDEVFYGEYGPGDFVGEMGLDGGPRSASVITLEPSVCAKITRPTLEAHLAAEPAFAIELLTQVIRRARAATLSAKLMALKDVYGRLKLLLQSMAAVQADGSFETLEYITHKDIAARVGCSREMISRELKMLEKAGAITVLPDRRLRWRRLPGR